MPEYEPRKGILPAPAMKCSLWPGSFDASRMNPSTKLLRSAELLSAYESFAQEQMYSTPTWVKLELF
jgi:hypothetical protein